MLAPGSLQDLGSKCDDVKMILKAGAVICGLIGLWTLYVGIVNFWRLPDAGWNITVLIVQILFIGISATPGIMLWRGVTIKRWQLAVIILVELTVIATGLLAAIAIGASYEPSTIR